MTEQALRDALRKAFGFGERHWQQADSESYSQNRKAGETLAKFDAFVDETCAALSQPQAAPAEGSLTDDQRRATQEEQKDVL